MVPGRRWGRSLEPFRGRHWSDELLGPLTNRAIDYDVVILHLQPDDMPRWQVEERGHAMVAITVWEFDRIPGHWAAIMNGCQAVIVPCEWNRRTFVAAGIDADVAVIPLLTAPPPRSPGPAVPLPGVREDDFVFYSIAAWRERNAPHLTLEAFLREFRASDRVALVLKTSRVNERRPCRGFFNYHVRRRFDTTLGQVAAVRRRCGSDARAVVIIDDVDDHGITALHRRGDAYVSLTRGEGWGLGACEAAWAANPVIITGHGGQRDFLDADAALLVGHRMVPFRDSSFPPSAPLSRLGVEWADPDIAMAGRLMRRLVDAPGEARERGRRLRAYVERRCETQPSIDRLVDVVVRARST